MVHDVVALVIFTVAVLVPPDVIEQPPDTLTVTSSPVAVLSDAFFEVAATLKEAFTTALVGAAVPILIY